MGVRVSVVIPVYNVERYLKECIDSVLAQTFDDYEIILVDDGSTDSSGKICDDYLEIDNRIRVIHRDNGGLSAARNTGMDAAVGEYIYFLDSDDYIEAQTLDCLSAIAEAEKANVVFFDGYVFYTDCEDDGTAYGYSRKQKYEPEQGREILVKLLNNNEFRTAVPLTFLKMDFLRKYDLRFYEGILHEDELFTFQVFNADGRVAHCHEQLYARRIRPASIMTSSGAAKRYVSMLTIYYELAEMYRAKKAEGKAATLYLIREAKSVIAKYSLLDEKLKKEYFESFNRFKKSVMRFKGFGDMKLKIKCSGFFMNIYYRAINRLNKKR